jgi:hypothetical protein
MDFYSLIDDVLELLRRRGRVTYRALKRQFHLDDDVLDDLKEELIKAQRVAVDENGDVLVWVGDAKSKCKRFVHSRGDLDSLRLSDSLDRSSDRRGIVEPGQFVEPRSVLA